MGCWAVSHYANWCGQGFKLFSNEAEARAYKKNLERVGTVGFIQLFKCVEASLKGVD